MKIAKLVLFLVAWVTFLNLYSMQSEQSITENIQNAAQRLLSIEDMPLEIKEKIVQNVISPAANENNFRTFKTMPENQGKTQQQLKSDFAASHVSLAQAIRNIRSLMRVNSKIAQELDNEIILKVLARSFARHQDASALREIALRLGTPGAKAWLESHIDTEDDIWNQYLFVSLVSGDKIRFRPRYEGLLKKLIAKEYPLFKWAINANAPGLLQGLIDAGQALPDNALSYALSQNKPQAARWLIEHDAPLTGDMLFVALDKQLWDIAVLLISKGAPVNVRDREGNTPLMLTITDEGGNVEVAKLLIEKGADVAVANNSCWTPLYQAIRMRNFDIAHELITYSPPTDLQQAKEHIIERVEDIHTNYTGAQEDQLIINEYKKLHDTIEAHLVNNQ